MITHLFFPHFFEIASLGYYTVTIVNTQKVMTLYDAKRFKDYPPTKQITHRNRALDGTATTLYCHFRNIEVESNDGSHLESLDALGPGRRIFKK